MDNNKAFVAYLRNIQKIEGADKIVQADVILNGIKITQVVVGIDTHEDTKVVYFDSNLCINPKVIEDIDKASPGYGQKDFSSLGNYLSKNGRVKVVKLRGVISNGLAVDFFKFTKYDSKCDFDEGYSFTSLNGVEVCHKYLPPIKVQKEPGNKKGKSNREKLRLVPEQFHYHIDTEQLLRNVGKIYPDQIVSISRKIHGTSAIYSRTTIKRPLTLKEKIIKFIGINVNNEVYGDIVSSRSVIKSIDIGKDSLKKKELGFYKIDVWTDAGNKYFKGKLHDGETVYYEIVGYLPNSQSMIQKGYDYGAKEGEYKIAVYRITMTGTDGVVYEYAWQQMKARCKQLEVPMVEEYFYGLITNLYEFDAFEEKKDIEDWRKHLLDYLKKTYLEKDCVDCKKKVPDEGIVIRVEGLGIEVYKYKSEKFLLGESKAAEDNQVDIEEEETANT
jgi:hypothetical protein